MKKTSNVDLHATPSSPVKNEKIEPIVNSTTTTTTTSSVATPTASPTASPTGSPMATTTTTTTQDPTSETLNTKAKIYVFKGLFKKSWHLENEANITVTKTELSFILARNEKKIIIFIGN